MMNQANSFYPGQQMTKDDKSDKIREQIDANLKRVFQESASEELPDRFKDLLSQLKNSDTSGGGGAAG